VAPASKGGKRIAEALGREVVEACSVRTRQGTLAVGIGAGLGAGVGAVLGGAILAGIGGGVGAAGGIAAAMALADLRKPKLAWQMALVVTDAGFELHSLSWRGAPKEVLVSTSYADVESLSVEPKWLTLRARIALRSGEEIELETTKSGGESGESALDALRERARPAPA
jgi:hypothetical protein